MEVVLIDGTYELFRHYYALPSAKDVDGREVAAVRGVVQSVLAMITGGARHVGVATDHVIESFRNDLWPGYKTGAGIEPDLWAQFPLLEEALAAAGVAVWPMVEFEADDALASAAAIAARDPRVERVVICTPDKDLAQCVRGSRVVQTNRRTRTTYDEAGIKAKFGVVPASIPDYLALVGDAADGYPGLKGWGAKSTAAVLAKFAHIESIPDDPALWSVNAANSGHAGEDARARPRSRAAVPRPGDAPHASAAVRRCRRAAVGGGAAGVRRSRGAARRPGAVRRPAGPVGVGRVPRATDIIASGPAGNDMTDDIDRRTFGERLGIAAVAGALHGLPSAADAQGRSGGGAAGGRDELCDLSAVELAARIRRKDVSAREVMTAHLARIERVNPAVNAIVTLVADRAMADAARADELTAKGGARGVLHGLPVAHKDLVDTAGIRTTKGSPFYRDTVPTKDALIVTRMRAAGAITVGKTNTPELGAGSQTFNTVFGATRNPYDLTKTCGGSSGGAAVALACGMVPIADGSDVGGSLRNPAAFCNVVGIRPSPGRVPSETNSWSPLARVRADGALRG